MKLNLNFHFVDNHHAKTVLLLHGFMSDCRSMESIGQELGGSYNILYVDLPGFGRSYSQKYDYGMETISLCINEILKELNLDAVHVLGYSMGGRVALSFASIYPGRVHSLILESASPGLIDTDEKEKRLDIDKNRAGKITESYQKFLDDWENMGLFRSQNNLSDEAFKQQREMREAQRPREVADSLLKYGTGVQPSYWERLQSLKMPVLLIVGAFDQKFVDINENMAKSIENAKLRIVDDAGHNIHLESAEKFDIIIKEFLK